MLVAHGRNVRLRVLFFVFLSLFKVHSLMWQGLDTALLLHPVPGKGNHSVAGSPFPQHFWSLSLPLTGQENNGKCVIQQFKTHSSPLLPSLGVSCINQWSPTFWYEGPVSRKTIFPWTVWGNSFRMIQIHYIYCAVYFYYCYTSSTSDQQAPRGWGPTDPRGWGPLV